MFQLEVLELNQDFGVSVLHGCHKLVHKLIVFLTVNPFFLDPEIVWVVQKTLVIGSDVKHYRQNVSGVKSSSSNVQV